MVDLYGPRAHVCFLTGSQGEGTMVRRRTVLLGITAVPPLLVTSARAQPLMTTVLDEEGVIVGEDRFPADQRVLTVEEYLELETALTGPASPYPSEVALGDRILEDAPSGRPYDVAQYFQDLRLGAFIDRHGINSPAYSTEWPYRANPVIVRFFDATATRTPNGDVTPWCAAFVNWCFRAAHGESATNSAASQTFRDWGTQTDNPQPADLAVFRRQDSPNQGHLGFYLGAADPSRRYIYVLGGNQGPQHGGNSGEVNIRRFDTQSTGNLRFHSYRTDPSLH